MFITFAIFSFILGTIIGSFLNVLTLRFNTGKTLWGRSGCASCGNTLTWRELVPILSFFLLRGRCKSCGSNISFQYPLVELLTGLLFFLSAIKVFPNGFPTLENLILLFVTFVVMSALMAIVVYDAKHKIIPDGFVLTFILSALLLMYLRGSVTGLELLAGPILAAPFAILWLVSKGAWMGLGDAKLAIGMGVFLGLSQGIFALLIAFWAGALFGIALLLLRLLLEKSSLVEAFPQFTMKSEIPFGPFLILGTLTVYFLNIDLALLGIAV